MTGANTFCQQCGSIFVKDTEQPQVCKDNGHHYFENPASSVDVIFFNEGGDVLIAERGFEPWKGMYDVVGGFTDIGESLEECFAREAQEETGLRRKDYGALHYVCSRSSEYPYQEVVKKLITVSFAAMLVSGVHPVANDDVASLKFVPIDEIETIAFCHPEIVQIIRQAYGLLFE